LVGYLHICSCADGLLLKLIYLLNIRLGFSHWILDEYQRNFD